MENLFDIRPISNEYTDQVIGLILPIQQIEFNVPVTLEGQPDLLDIERFYHQTGGGFWGAFADGELIGTIGLIATGHHSGAIRKMFVKKEFRGRELGIAQQLLEQLIGYSRANHIETLLLGTVDLLKAAHRFYEKNGFEKVRLEELPAYFPRMSGDDTFYRLSLSKEDSKVL